MAPADRTISDPVPDHHLYIMRFKHFRSVRHCADSQPRIGHIPGQRSRLVTTAGAVISQSGQPRSFDSPSSLHSPECPGPQGLTGHKVTRGHTSYRGREEGPPEVIEVYKGQADCYPPGGGRRKKGNKAIAIPLSSSLFTTPIKWRTLSAFWPKRDHKKTGSFTSTNLTS